MTQEDQSHRRTRKGLTNHSIALLLLFISWPVSQVHRFWNNAAVNKVHWFLTDVINSRGELLTQDIQWYIFDTGNYLSVSLILLSFIVCRKKTRTYQIVLSTIFAISLSDILHYWLSFKQSEWIVQFQGATMVILSIWILTKPFIKWRKV